MERPTTAQPGDAARHVEPPPRQEPRRGAARRDGRPAHGADAGERSRTSPRPAPRPEAHPVPDPEEAMA